MTRRSTLSDIGVAALKPRAARFTFPDPELRGHYVRVMPSGAKSFVAVSRDPNGKQVWATIGSTDELKIEEAREKARQAIQRIKQGQTEDKPTTYRAVAENWLKRHVDAKGLLSEKEIRRCLSSYIYPHWADREFLEHTPQRCRRTARPRRGQQRRQDRRLCAVHRAQYRQLVCHPGR